MRADRLISLLMLLQVNGRMTARDLAGRLEVSVRTIYRDLDALSASGVPVYTERGPHGGCELMESYRTNLTGLTESEVQALFMLTVPGLLADLGAAGAAETAHRKLAAALPAPFQRDAARVRERLYLDPAGWFQPVEPVPFLSLLQEATWQDRRLRLTYRRSDGRWVERLVEPYGLVAKASIWYLVAASFGNIVVYRVSRIQAAELAEGRFERPEQFDLAAYWAAWCARFEAERTAFQVTIRVGPVGISRLITLFGEGVHQLIADADSPDEQGRVTLTIAADSAESACQRLLGLGPAVEVLAPPELQALMAAVAREQLAFYGPRSVNRG